MSAQFEAEIANSMAKLNATVQRLEQSVAKANTQMTGLGRSTAVAATHTGTLQTQFAKAQASAARFGGAAGGAVAQVASLAALNPAMLAVGAAVGLIASQFGSLLDRVREVNAEIPRTADLVGKVRSAMGAQAGAAASGLDLAGFRAQTRAEVLAGGESSASAVGKLGVSPAEAERNLAEFRKTAPNAKLTDMQAEQIAAGNLGMDREKHIEFRNKLIYNARYQTALQRQTVSKELSAERQAQLLTEAAGGSSARTLAVADIEERMRALEIERRFERAAMQSWNWIGITSGKQNEQELQWNALQSTLDMYRSQSGEANK